MSGIAEILHNLKYSVQGSDITETANVKRLRRLGIQIFIGHNKSNVEKASVVVISSAVKQNNPEILEARSKLLPVVPRAEMLAEIMRLRWGIAVAGTHGKTTTTSIISSVLDAGDLDPTVINGGIINAYGTNARLGHGDWIVVEADESDGTFTRLPATIAVVTNIDLEHIEYYGNFEKLTAAFAAFIQNIPFYGFASICIDDQEVQALIPKVPDRRIITYGFSPQADIRATTIRNNPNGSTFAVTAANRNAGTVRTLGDFTIPMIGNHNILNALAAISIACEMGIEQTIVKKALSRFSGVERRFTKTGVVKGITIIDDYGHHPAEIAAVLSATRSTAEGKVIAVVQPHRFTRVRDLFDDYCRCFNDADTVIVSDIYPAGEDPIEGINKTTLIEGIRSRGHRDVLSLETPKTLTSLILTIAREKDYVVCLGAGDITKWANELPKSLEQSFSRTKKDKLPC